MPKNIAVKEIEMSDYFDLPNPGLKAYFDRTKSGNLEIYRTPFYGNQDKKDPDTFIQTVVSQWEDYLKQHLGKFPELLEYENEQRAKLGPNSYQLPLKDRWDDIEHYYDDISLSSKPISASAVAGVLMEFRQVRGTKLRNQWNTWFNMKKSKSSGNPFFAKKSSVVDKTIQCELSNTGPLLNDHGDRMSQVLGCAMSKKRNTFLPSDVTSYWYTTAILGWRGQSGGPKTEDIKQRVVWMFPFGVSIRELQAYQPLIEQCQKFKLVPAWVSMEEVDASITKLFDTKGKDDLVICTDFSKFDQHFNFDMANAAKTILTGLLNADPDSKKWLESVFPVKYNIPLMCEEGKLLFGNHGMASGSGGTNFDETLVHRALQFEAAQNDGKNLNLYSQCLGDDGILSYPGITVDSVIRSYTAHGQEMNETKQYVSTHDCVYLRRWHDINYRVDGICVGVYPTMRALNSLFYQERFYDPDEWSAKMVSLRQLSIIENCKYHPLFHEFIDFCMKGDRYELGRTIPGFLENIDTIAQEAIEYMPDFLGYSKSFSKDAASGLSEWEVVKYLKSL